MTTNTRRRALAAPALAELALPVLEVAFGLQLLRLMIPTVVSVYRERLGAPLVSLALFAFVAFLLGFLAAPVVSSTVSSLPSPEAAARAHSTAPEAPATSTMPATSPRTGQTLRRSRVGVRRQAST